MPNMKRALKGAVGLVVACAFAFVVGVLMHFVPWNSAGLTGIAVVGGGAVVIYGLKEHGWWIW